MPNAYTTLNALKSPAALNIAGSDYDQRLLQAAQAASAVIDAWCNRHFYTLRATRRLDCDSPRILPLPDLIAIAPNGLRTDDAGDGHFATIWNPADYRLLPADADPAANGNPASRPYTAIEAVAAKTLPIGSARVQITGDWGWSTRLRPLTATAKAIPDPAATEIALSAATHGISPGNTLLIDAEQMRARAVDGETVSVQRAANGTTAAPHNEAAPVSIYQYPPPISEAALTLAARLWRGILSPETPARRPGIPPDIAALLAPYRKPALGVA